MAAVGKLVKAGWAFWGGINVYFGGDVVFTGAGDKFTIDFYTENAGINDSILFRFQLFNRYGGVETIEVDAYYTDANDTQVGSWKTLEFALPDGAEGSYNQMVIFLDGIMPVMATCTILTMLSHRALQLMEILR